MGSMSLFGQGLLRIITGFLFMTHGSQKLLGFPSEMEGGRPELFTQIGLAGVLELFGGFLILIGLATRPVAFLLSGMMAVAYFTVHAQGGFWPLENGGELAVLYCFVFFFFMCAGAGGLSVDSQLGKGKKGGK